MTTTNEPIPMVRHCGKRDAHKLHTYIDIASFRVLMRCTGLVKDAPQPNRPMHKPERGSDIEAWLKAKRDARNPNSRVRVIPYVLIDILLSEYRFRADHDLDMDDDIPEGFQ